MIISNEADVRHWVKMLGVPVWWIEPAMGSTLGLPDCFMVVNGETWFCELKAGRRGVDGGLRFKLRPEQRRVLGEMHDAGLIVKVVVGVVGTDEIKVLGWCKMVSDGIWMVQD